MGRAAKCSVCYFDISELNKEKSQKKNREKEQRQREKEQRKQREKEAGLSRAATYSQRFRDNFKKKLSTASGEELERLKQIKAHRAAQAEIRYRNFVERKKMRVAA